MRIDGVETTLSYLYDPEAMTMTPPRGYATATDAKRRSMAEKLYFRYYDAFLESPPTLLDRSQL